MLEQCGRCPSPAAAKNRYRCSQISLHSKYEVLLPALANQDSFHCLLLSIIILRALNAKIGKVRPADKLQVKAAEFLPLVGLAGSKQDPINRGHGD